MGVNQARRLFSASYFDRSQLVERSPSVDTVWSLGGDTVYRWISRLQEDEDNVNAKILKFYLKFDGCGRVLWEKDLEGGDRQAAVLFGRARSHNQTVNIREV
jgi:hypothetical protein